MTFDYVTGVFRGLVIARYYFYNISRDDAAAYLDATEVGSFLIRDSSKESCLVISLKQSQKVLHLLVLRRPEVLWFLRISPIPKFV